jgi:phage terminase large subunit-like protein
MFTSAAWTPADRERERARIAIARERRRRDRERSEAGRFDWYGPPCTCPIPPGRSSCREHPRAHEGQRPPAGNWTTWLYKAGRGTGKSRAGVEWVRWRVEHCGKRRIALVAPTAADARDVIVEGEAGILAVCPPWNRPLYEPSKRRLTWPNGAIATTYSADEPERLRGPQHEDAYCDEIGSWRYPDAWDMLMFGLRLGDDPRVLVTATPRPTKLFRSILRAPTTATTGGSTYENRDNLAPKFFAEIVARYEGTRLGRQEIDAELLEDVPGALWNLDRIEALRLAELPPGVTLARVVVAIDPATTSAEGSDETGIVVAAKGSDGRGYVLADRSLRGSPDAWARAAVDAAHEFRADRVVAEANNGGDMVELTLRTVDRSLPYRKVWASRGKQTRAEPVAALYEQGRCHHLGAFPELEAQMTGWVPGQSSPDRLDALVWAFSELLVTATSPAARIPSFTAGYRG